MSRSFYKIQFGADTVVLSWDGSQASAPIRADGEDTGYQTADARHRVTEAVRLVAARTWPEEGSFAEGSDAWDALAFDAMPDEPTVSGIGV